MQSFLSTQYYFSEFTTMGLESSITGEQIWVDNTKKKLFIQYINIHQWYQQMVWWLRC